MRIPLRNPVSTEHAPVSLTTRVHRRGRVTEIRNPDTMFPADHSVNSVDPHVNAEEIRRSVREQVAGLAAAGALDQDNLEALSWQIDSWLQTWVALAHRTAATRREVAELLLAQTLQNQAEVARELTTLLTRYAELDAARHELLRQVGFADDLVRAHRVEMPDRDRPASRVRALRDAGRATPGPPTGPLPVPVGAAAPPSAAPVAGFAASAGLSHS